MLTKVAAAALTGVMLMCPRADAGQPADEQAIKALCTTFATGLVTQNAKLRAGIYTEDGTLVTPFGIVLVGRDAMVKDFGPEAKSVVTPTTRMEFSNYRFRFLTPDIAFVDADITLHDGKGPPNGKLRPITNIFIAFTAVRRGEKWLIQDERTVTPNRQKMPH